MKFEKYALTVLACALATVAVARAASASPSIPNIVLILADDLGYGDLGCYGATRLRTPNLDHLARQGLRFTQAYAPSSTCTPSRYALMTGEYAWRQPPRKTSILDGDASLCIEPGQLALPALLKQAGYTTALVDKWGLGYPESQSVPNKMGFDYFYGYNCQRKAHEYYPQYLWRNNQKVPLDGKTYSDDLLLQEALAFIKRNHDKPFSLYLPFTLPHAKLQVPDLGVYKNTRWEPKLKTIAAMITRLDQDVGRLMALLHELKLDEQTLVCFASDNGATYRDALFNHSGPLRGYKRYMYEGGLRSPSIARWPGHIPKGVVSQQVWAFWDFLPTMAELTGQPAPAGLDGISILPALLQGKTLEHPPLYFEFHERGFTQAARIGDWKAVRLGAKKPIELYDLKTDLGENHDVASLHPEVVTRFAAFLQTARVNSEIWPIREKVAGPSGRGGKKKKKTTAALQAPE